MKNNKTYQRFDRVFRIQHIVLFTSVLLLIVSGVPLKFPDSEFAQLVIDLQGGMNGRATIHHTAGLMLIGLGIFHIIYYLFFDTKIPVYKRTILIRPKDAGDMVRHLGYIVGLRKTLPPMGRYTWFEKLDYIGVIWGLVVMGFTGLLMLYMDFALQFMPMSWIQILWAAHSEEAMLATLFLLIIHMYHVHFNPEKFPMTLTWLHGRISREEMEKYHALELAELEAGEEAQAEPASEER